MIVGVVTAQSASEAEDQIRNDQYCDAYELRLDFWPELDLLALQKLRDAITVPLIFTLRNKENGGQYRGTESARLSALFAIAAMNPDYLDIEHTVSVEVIQKLKNQYPQLRFLRSYHNMQETPENLAAILQSLQHPAIDAYKIATQANSTLDGLRMLNLLQQHLNEHNRQGQASAKNTKALLVGVCMGERGQFTRVLAPLVGSAWVYAATGSTILPGLLSAKELIEIYRVKRLSQQADIYAVLGDPVEHSVGPIFHNAYFEEQGINAVYVKCQIAAVELSEFFSEVQSLNFKGLSITMPLKAAVVDFIDEADEIVKTMGILNTIKIEKTKRTGSNTDAPGALAAIHKHLEIRNKKVLIIGAGGAAKAIAYSLFHAGAQLSLINRTEEKAQNLQKEMSAKFDGLAQQKGLPASNVGSVSHQQKWLPEVLNSEKLSEVKQEFSLLINTIPHDLNSQAFINSIVHDVVTPDTVVMDCVYSPAETYCIQAAKKRTKKIIYGKELYEEQAIRQLQHWYLRT